ncbi:MAG TPA: FAD:protein FMN transferase, partial [Limnochordia bacterium]|nr:FAD:protein FMN transferase [Limnochordia bacterium]
ARRGGDWRGVRLDRTRRTVMLPPGAALDFGGIAKGMAVDAALATLRAQGVRAALVDAGGDLAVLGTPPGEAGWPIAVAAEAERSPWMVTLQRGALATSGVGRRRWQKDGVWRHHLIDPRTGLSAAGGLRAASVAAGSCRQAEVAAKTALILGPEAGARFLAAHRLAGLLVDDEGRRLSVGAWPAEEGDG